MHVRSKRDTKLMQSCNPTKMSAAKTYLGNVAGVLDDTECALTQHRAEDQVVKLKPGQQSGAGGSLNVLPVLQPGCFLLLGGARGGCGQALLDVGHHTQVAVPFAGRMDSCNIKERKVMIISTNLLDCF